MVKGLQIYFAFLTDLFLSTKVIKDENQKFSVLLHQSEAFYSFFNILDSNVSYMTYYYCAFEESMSNSLRFHLYAT